MEIYTGRDLWRVRKFIAKQQCYAASVPLYENYNKLIEYIDDMRSARRKKGQSKYGKKYYAANIEYYRAKKKEYMRKRRQKQKEKKTLK